MSAAWHELLQSLLLGTARKPSLPSETYVGDLASNLAAQLDPADLERLILSRTALLGTAQRAGFTGLELMPSPTPANHDSLPPFSPYAGTVFRRLLADFPELLPEFYTTCRQHGKRIPEVLLVDALVQAESKPSLHDTLIPVLGRRGTWLASQNPAWAFAVPITPIADSAIPADESVWQTGSHEQRIALIRALRGQTPAMARQLAETTWKQESPDFRAEVIRTFETGLSIDDEPFLETCLNDRRKEVRTVAQNLLVRLPDSAYVRRQLARAAGCLKIHFKPKGLLTRITGGQDVALLEVELPTECSKDMERDGITAKVPAGQKIGERAWWFGQILMSVSPSALAAHLGLSGEQLEQAVRDNKEWGNNILLAWREAVKRCHDAAWAFRLYQRENTVARSEFLPFLHADQREAILIDTIRCAKPEELQEVVGQVLAGNSVIPVPVARVLLNLMKQLTASDPAATLYIWHLPWEKLAMAIPAEVLEEAVTGWPLDSAGWEHWKNHIEKFLQPVQLRVEFHRELTR